MKNSSVANRRGSNAIAGSSFEVMERFYPIGTPGQPWGPAERRQWFDQQTVQRSYRDEVLARIDRLTDTFEVQQYGALPVDPDRYPLLAGVWPSTAPGAPWVLITGGVHGYETSGVQGALAFIADGAAAYADRLNLVVAPCVSPWGYEVINRWNPDALDPNRSFHADSPANESAALMRFVAGLGVDWLVHMDLHETTDSDEDEFRPAVAARDGTAFQRGRIPDGFYTVGDTENPQPEFQAAVIAGVEAVTHIAPADDAGQIIGTDITQRGVINYPNVELGLCAGMTGATYTTTTEVYPDSPEASPEICIAAQAAAVRAGLDFALARSLLRADADSRRRARRPMGAHDAARLGSRAPRVADRVLESARVLALRRHVLGEHHDGP